MKKTIIIGLSAAKKLINNVPYGCSITIKASDANKILDSSNLGDQTKPNKKSN